MAPQALCPHRSSSGAMVIKTANTYVIEITIRTPSATPTLDQHEGDGEALDICVRVRIRRAAQVRP
jgi:hypothetical protein